MIRKLSRERLFDLLDYDPETGVFTWKKITTNKVRVGQVAGNIMVMGYRKIIIDGEFFLAHRLAWFYVHGRWPVDQIDHINGDRLDNRIANLREATGAQNSANSPTRKSKTGLRCVSKNERSPNFSARITVRGQLRHLGSFPTKEAAHAAYVAAAQEAFGEFIRAE